MGLLRSPMSSYYSSVRSLTARGVASGDADQARAAKRPGSVQGILAGLNPATQTLRARLIGRVIGLFASGTRPPNSSKPRLERAGLLTELGPVIEHRARS